MFVKGPGLRDLRFRQRHPNTERYNRLLWTPVMRPVVQRFVDWLATHDPKRCRVESNDVMVGYCAPHYYAALCESSVDAVDDFATGALRLELDQLLARLVGGDR